MATEATTDTSALAAAKRKEFTRSMIELAGMLPVLIAYLHSFCRSYTEFSHPE